MYDGPERRSFWGARLGVGHVVLFAIVILAIFAGYGLLQNYGKHQRQEICRKANELRRESNRRAPQHETDAKNLLDLLHAITATRAIEAQVFGQFEDTSRRNLGVYAADPVLKKYLPQIKDQIRLIRKLRARYEQAGELDAQITMSEEKVHFNRVEIIDCDHVE